MHEMSLTDSSQPEGIGILQDAVIIIELCSFDPFYPTHLGPPALTQALQISCGIQVVSGLEASRKPRARMEEVQVAEHPG